MRASKSEAGPANDKFPVEFADDISTCDVDGASTDVAFFPGFTVDCISDDIVDSKSDEIWSTPVDCPVELTADCISDVMVDWRRDESGCTDDDFPVELIAD